MGLCKSCKLEHDRYFRTRTPPWIHCHHRDSMKDNPCVCRYEMIGIHYIKPSGVLTNTLEKCKFCPECGRRLGEEVKP